MTIDEPRRQPVLPAETARAFVDDVTAGARPMTPDERASAERLHFAPVVLGDVPDDLPDPIEQLTAELDAVNRYALPTLPTAPPPAEPVEPVPPLIFDELVARFGALPERTSL